MSTTRTTTVNNIGAQMMRQAIPGKGPRPGDGTWLEDDDTYYYKLNRKNMRYYCEHERHLLRRNLYSKRELDIYMEELYMYDQPKSHKICGVMLLVIGFFMIMIGLVLWIWAWKWSGTTGGWTTFWYIIGALLIVGGAVICCLGWYDLSKRNKNKNVRRARLTPIINDENYRIAHRGLNWQLHDEHLALRTNYWNPLLRRRAQQIVTTTTTQNKAVPQYRPMNVVTVQKPVSGAVTTTIIEKPVVNVVEKTVVTSPVVQNTYVTNPVNTYTTETVVSNPAQRYRNNLI